MPLHEGHRGPAGKGTKGVKVKVFHLGVDVDKNVRILAVQKAQKLFQNGEVVVGDDHPGVSHAPSPPSPNQAKSRSTTPG